MTFSTPQELASLLKVAPDFVLEKVRKNQWPCQRLGPRTIRFTEDQVGQILALTEAKPGAQTTRARTRRLDQLLGNKRTPALARRG